MEVDKINKNYFQIIIDFFNNDIVVILVNYFILLLSVAISIIIVWYIVSNILSYLQSSSLLKVIISFLKKHNILYLLLSLFLFWVIFSWSIFILTFFTDYNKIYILWKEITVTDKKTETELEKSFQSFTWIEEKFKDKLDLINDYNKERIWWIQTTLDIVTLFFSLLVIILWVVWFAQYKEIKDSIWDKLLEKIKKETELKLKEAEDKIDNFNTQELDEKIKKVDNFTDLLSRIWETNMEEISQKIDDIIVETDDINKKIEAIKFKIKPYEKLLSLINKMVTFFKK